ncbi:MAG: rod shape-determining protein MreD [Ruminococcaceae bacterium]|nr:rod shape-determining protein MreD [Oscillospiraceae bacterium]
MFQPEFLNLIKKYFLAAAIFLLQLIFADRIRILGVAPDFVFAFVLALSFHKESGYSLWSAIILGFFSDCVSGRFFGIHTTLLVLTALGIRELYHGAFSENFVLEAIYGLIACLLYSLCYALFTSLFEGNFWVLLYRTALLEFVYNFAMFLLMHLVQKRNRKKHRSVFRI